MVQIARRNSYMNQSNNNKIKNASIIMHSLEIIAVTFFIAK